MQSDSWSEINKKSYYQQLQSLQQKLRSAQHITQMYMYGEQKPKPSILEQLVGDVAKFNKVLQVIVFTCCSLGDKKQKEQNVMMTIMQNDVISLINEIEDMLTYVVAQSNSQAMTDEFEMFQTQRFDITMNQQEIRYCCDRKMLPNAKQSELVCGTCARVYRYNELLFEKSNAATGERKSKPNKYNPMRNFNKWMDKITCKDERVDRAILDRIVAKFEKDHKGFQRGKLDINIKAIRRCLKQLGLSKYNTRLAYIRQYLTLQQPPEFSETDIRRIADYYSQIIHIYYHISNKYNIPYCPHIIAKIVENIFPEDQDKQRIKQFIHFQNPGTVWKFDNIWRQICTKIPEFIYTPVAYGFDD